MGQRLKEKFKLPETHTVILPELKVQMWLRQIQLNVTKVRQLVKDMVSASQLDELVGSIIPKVQKLMICLSKDHPVNQLSHLGLKKASSLRGGDKKDMLIAANLLDAVASTTAETLLQKKDPDLLLALHAQNVHDQAPDMVSVPMQILKGVVDEREKLEITSPEILALKVTLANLHRSAKQKVEAVEILKSVISDFEVKYRPHASRDTTKSVPAAPEYVLDLLQISDKESELLQLAFSDAYRELAHELTVSGFDEIDESGSTEAMDSAAWYLDREIELRKQVISTLDQGHSAFPALEVSILVAQSKRAEMASVLENPPDWRWLRRNYRDSH